MNITELKSEGLKKVFKVVVPAAELDKTVDEKIKNIVINTVLDNSFYFYWL